MMPPLLADDSAVTALPPPVSNTDVQEQAVLVHAVFHPSVDTQTSSPPISQVLAFCWSWVIGVQNLAFGSQSDLGPPGSPVMLWAAQVGLTKSANECPPSVVLYIVPSTYSPARLFAFAGSTITEKPSPPAGSTIWLLPEARKDEPLSCRPPQTAVPPPESEPAL